MSSACIQRTARLWNSKNTLAVLQQKKRQKRQISFSIFRQIHLSFRQRNPSKRQRKRAKYKRNQRTKKRRWKAAIVCQRAFRAKWKAAVVSQRDSSASIPESPCVPPTEVPSTTEQPQSVGSSQPVPPPVSPEDKPFISNEKTSFPSSDDNGSDGKSNFPRHAREKSTHSRFDPSLSGKHGRVPKRYGRKKKIWTT